MESNPILLVNSPCFTVFKLCFAIKSIQVTPQTLPINQQHILQHLINVVKDVFVAGDHRFERRIITFQLASTLRLAQATDV